MRKASPLLWLTALIVIAYADIIFAGRGLFLQDITTYHYPMKHVVREVIARGEFPFWNRYQSGGQPLAANPAYEVFYPLQWLIFLPSFHFGLQLHILIHFLIAGIGAYRLARSLGCGTLAATFAGISFAFCGPVLSLSTKLPILFSCAWMPWSLDFGRRFLLTRDRLAFAGAAVTLGLQAIIAEPTVLMQTAALLLGYAVWTAAAPGGAFRRIALVAAMGAAGMAIAAVQLIPAADFARDTVRSQTFPFVFVANWSTPPARALELIVPKYFEHVKDDQGRALIASMYPYRIEGFLPSFYLGIGVLILAAAGVITRMRGWGVMLGTIAAFGLIAAGEHTPLLRILYDVGIFRAVRFPEKFVLAPALILIIWAALVLERGEKRGITAAAILAGVIALIALLPRHVEPNWLVADVLLRIAVVAVVLRYPRWAVAVMALDVWSATRDLVPRMPRSFFDPAPIAQHLPPTGRIYSEAAWDWWDQKPISFAYFGNKTVEEYWWTLRDGAFPNVPAYWGYQLALEDDVDRTSLLNTDALRDELKRLRRSGFGAEEPLLHVSNVTALLRFRPVEGQSGPPVEVVPVADSPRYFLQPPGEVTDLRETDNAIHLQTRGATRSSLVLSVTGHRYWSATVDGQDAQLMPAYIAYQSLDVPPGSHTIELRYRNPLFAWSGAVSLIALAAMVTMLAWRKRATDGSPA